MRYCCDLTRITIDSYAKESLTTVFVMKSNESAFEPYVAPLPFILNTKFEYSLVCESDKDNDTLTKLAKFLLYQYDVIIKNVKEETKHSFIQNRNIDDQIEKEEYLALENRKSLSQQMDIVKKLKESKLDSFKDIKESDVELVKQSLLLLSGDSVEFVIKTSEHSFILSAFTAYKEAFDFYRGEKEETYYSSLLPSSKLELMKNKLNKDDEPDNNKTIHQVLSEMTDILSDKKKLRRSNMKDLFGFRNLFPSADFYFNILNDGATEELISEAFDTLWVLRYMRELNVSFANKHTEESFYLMSGLKDLSNSHKHMAAFIDKRIESDKED